MAGTVALAAIVPAFARQASSLDSSKAHPRWNRVFLLSFRSLDLLSNEPDEQWGVSDGRLTSGRILTDFPVWLQEQQSAIEAARAEGRPILISLVTHGGYGTGLVTYSQDLKTAQVANYPWLIRRLTEAGLADENVTVSIDTCNAQAAGAHQLRPDLVPAGVNAWPPFTQWRRSDPHRLRLTTSEAYALFAQDRVRAHLAPSARGSRKNVAASELVPLTTEERRKFRGRLYGPKGVIFGTPALFNLLRLGLDTRGTYTANLLTAPLEKRVLNSGRVVNEAEFRRFKDFAFLDATGVDTVAAAVRSRPEPAMPMARSAADD
jgi:hypothetical protein